VTHRRPKSDIRADINVTPLVDIVLVLLIIFMVVAPVIAQAVPVELPRTVHHGSKADDGSDLPVSVTRDEQIYLRTTRVAVADLPRLVNEARRGAAGQKVFLQGDSLTQFRAVRELMEALRKANVDQVMLRTEAARPTH
jgi:biopolymer transport protein ExbD